MASINTNVVSLNAQRNQAASQSSLATSMQRLSSGLRVNSAKDDAAGLAIAERMSAQVKGMNVAVRNANDAISQMQTAEGAMGKIGENLQRIRELAVQSSNGSLSQPDRDNLQLEVDQLQEEIVRVVDNSKFNGVALFDGASKSIDFQIGADNGDKITADTTGFDLKTSGNLKAYATGAKAKAIDISSQASAQTVLDDMDTDIDTVNTARSTAGALQSRFEAVISQLQVTSENTAAARGRIMDADFASETANLSRAQILQQAGTAMIAQANQLPQQVMQLLR